MMKLLYPIQIQSASR